MSSARVGNPATEYLNRRGGAVVDQPGGNGGDASRPDGGSESRPHHVGAPNRPNVLKPGAVLQSRYRIQDLIGVGGMSTVYRARDLRFAGVERLCAVKEMFNLGDDPRVRQLRLTNFQREAALLATLSHQAIPRIYDFFEHQGSIYLVIELIAGHDMETLLTRRGDPFEERQLIDWTLELVDVLTYLHGQKPEPIIFRDLKPSNIMIRENNSLTLVDFGIARSFAPQQKGTMIGTEGYAPPEQYRGIADARGDIYALGATLHHLSTGSDPRGEVPFTFNQRPPRRLNQRLSAGFEELILKCTNYVPSERYGSVAELRDALLALRTPVAAPPVVQGKLATERDGSEGSRTLGAQPMTAPLRTVEQRSANDRLAWSVITQDEVRGSANAAGGAVYVGSYDTHLYALDETDGGVRWRFRAQRGIVSRPLPSSELLIFGAEDHNVYAVTRQQGRQIWVHRTAGPIRSSPQGDERSCYVGSDDGYLYRLDRARGAVIWRYKTWGPVRSTPCLTERHLLFGSDDGYLYCIERDSAKLEWRHNIGTGVVASPVVGHGVVVVGAGDGAIRGFDQRDGRVLWTQQTKKTVIASGLIVDQTILVGSADGHLRALDVISGEINWSERLCKQITSSATLDGEVLYVGGISGSLYCVNRADGNVRWHYETGGPVVSRPLLTADYVVFGSIDGKVYAVHREI